MEIKLKVAGRIARPVRDVFEAVVDPTKLSQYFTTGGAVGRLETGAIVTWDFADFPGAFPVTVVEVVEDRRIVLRWEAPGMDDGRGEAGHTTITMSFEPLEDGRTLVSITEAGWPETEAAFAACIGNTEGWTGMLCAMKAWVEYGINLRDGFYK